MKEELYTIPVMDGFRKDCECALCAMRHAAEERAIGFILSPSYMETDVRDQTNELGFCPTHLQKLYARQNALGLALMLQSYLSHQRQNIEAAVGARPICRRANKEGAVAACRRRVTDSCYLCTQVDTTMERCLEAFFFLFKKEASFADTLWNSRGFCLEHFLLLYERSQDFLSGRSLQDFQAQLYELEQKNLDRMKKELDWFIRKFDYRFRDESWKNSKDALPRSMLKCRGLFPDD